MNDPVTRPAFADALIAELLTAVDAVVGGVTGAAVTGAAASTGWRIAAQASGTLTGEVVLWVDRAGSEALARRVMGMDGAPDEATVADMLGELWSQAAGALSLKEPFAGVKLVLGRAEAGDTPDGAVRWDLLAGEPVAGLAVGGTAVPSPVEAAVAPAAVGAVAAGRDAQTEKLDLVLDIEMPLVVRFARTVMSIKALAALGPGSIVDMERTPDDPVQMLVGDRVIARGEVVVVGGNYGVRVTDLVNPTERVRLLEA